MSSKRKNNSVKGKHPRDRASFFSHFLFCWQLKLLKTCSVNKSLDYEQIKNHDSNILGFTLEKFWMNEENSGKKVSLKRVLFKMFATEFALYGLIYIPIQLIANFLQPFYIKKLLEALSLNFEINEVYYYGAVLIAVTFVTVLTNRIFALEMTSFGMKVRISCCALVYRKLLTTKKINFQKKSIGYLVNLLSNDTERFDKVFYYFHIATCNFIQFLISIWFLYYILGSTSLAGFLIPILLFAAQIYLFRKISALRKILAFKTDQRIKLISDFINGIQSFKIFAWEKHFEKVVETSRKSELEDLQKMNNYRINNYTFTLYFYRICILLSLVAVVASGFEVTAQYIFVFLNFYEHLNSSLHRASAATIIISEFKVSLERIEEFILSTLTPQQSSDHFLKIVDEDFFGVDIKNVTVEWTPSKESLSEVSISACNGLNVILGSAGSGKSTLLQTILKEVPIKSGQMLVNGKISFAPQTPWIFPASIKENILFGEDFSEERYKKVLRICALEEDIASFSYGDNSLVGEKGVLLSGGQKARINLARAVYKSADIYLLDDTLSAVDAVVADKIFKECVLQFLEEKCVLLVTHQVQYAASAKRIYVLQEGKVQSEEISEKKNFVENENTVNSQNVKFLGEDETEESMETGGVNTYKWYFLSGNSVITVSALLIFFVLIEVLMSYSDYFLSFWVHSKKTNKFLVDVNLLYTFASIVIVSVLCSHIAGFAFVKIATNSSKHLHTTFFKKILKCPMSFFHKNSSGRILNRFSKDMGIIDDYIPITFSEIIREGLESLGFLVVIFILNFWMIIPILTMFVFFYFYYRKFQPALNNIKQLEGIRRSPIFTHISTTVNGLDVIKALNKENYMLSKFNNYLNCHSSILYLYNAMFSTFGFCTNFSCWLFAVVVTLTSIIFRELDTGYIGLSIIDSITLIKLIEYVLVIWGQHDIQKTSIERVYNFKEISEEPNDGDLIPRASWPEKGNIDFQNVNLQYSSDKPLVLQNINLTIKNGEKVGIVGRTGAGKTSLISILFRLFDYQGDIFIDEVNIKSVPLETLRSKIAVIPQEPILFLGSLRTNLDPFGEFSDMQIWQALEDVELKDFVSNLASGLDFEVSEGGTNFSCGQRQLLCMVRAILKNAKIVVLDEATASVDLATDALVQKTLRKSFKDATVLTIAHRLETVMDSDKILVMNSGRVVEFGEVDQLLATKRGYFYNYVNAQKETKTSYLN